MQTVQAGSLNGNGRPSVRCAACGRPFVRKSRSRAAYCSEPCRRRARAARERSAYAARRHLTSEVVTRAISELRAQVERDESNARPPQWPTLEARIAGLVDAHAAMLGDELGGRYACRQALLDTAALAVQMAALLPRPTVRLDSDQRATARARRAST